MLQCVAIHSGAMNAEVCRIAEFARYDLIKEFLTVFAAADVRSAIRTFFRHLPSIRSFNEPCYEMVKSPVQESWGDALAAAFSNAVVKR